MAACQDDDNSNLIRNDNPGPTSTELTIPPQFDYITRPIIPEDNPLSEEGIALGKKLFFEKKNYLETIAFLVVAVIIQKMPLMTKEML